MGWLRNRLTYGNVMATLAVFISLGGAAYAIEANSVQSKHIAPNAATGKDVKEPSLRGIGGGILGGEVPNLNTLPNGVGFNPIGGWGGSVNGASNQNNTFVAPRKFIATRLRVVLTGDLFKSGTREVTFSRNIDLPGETLTPLSCTIQAPDFRCRSNARVTYKEGQQVAVQVESSPGAIGGEDLSFGWVALTP